MGNSIFTIRQGEALPYSTQSRETITREGGRKAVEGCQGTKRKCPSSWWPACSRQKTKCSLLIHCTVRCICKLGQGHNVSSLITVGIIILPKYVQLPVLENGPSAGGCVFLSLPTEQVCSLVTFYWSSVSDASPLSVSSVSIHPRKEIFVCWYSRNFPY